MRKQKKPTDLKLIQALELAYELNAGGSHRSNPRIHDQLNEALHTARNARDRIPQVQAELQELLDADMKDGQDEKWLGGRRYQIALAGLQLNRAADLADERLKHFASIRSGVDVEKELLKCREDKHHWLHYYAWGFDPRPDSPLSTIPTAEKRTA